MFAANAVLYRDNKVTTHCSDVIDIVHDVFRCASTYQQLLTVGWVPKQLLQKAVFDAFIFEGGGGSKNLLLGRTPNGVGDTEQH